MKKVKRISLLLISLLLLGGGFTKAQGWGRMMDPGEYCSNLPGISEEQKAKLAVLSEKHRTEMDALRAERQTTTDREAWSAAAKKMSELMLKHREEVMNVLTAEQKELFTFRQGGRFVSDGSVPAPGFGRGMMMSPAGRGAGRGMMMSPAGRGAGRGMMMSPPAVRGFRVR